VDDDYPFGLGKVEAVRFYPGGKVRVPRDLPGGKVRVEIFGAKVMKTYLVARFGKLRKSRIGYRVVEAPGAGVAQNYKYPHVLQVELLHSIA
jgi:hypothetical protein